MGTKQVQVLENGTEIHTTKEGWMKDDIGKCQVAMAGWALGKSSHHPISLGLALACKDIIPDAYMGDVKGVNEKGDDILVPVIDPLILNTVMQNEFIETHNLDVQTIRAAGSRVQATKQLTEIAASPEVMAILKEQNHDLYEKLSKMTPKEEKPAEDGEAEESEGAE